MIENLQAIKKAMAFSGDRLQSIGISYFLKGKR